MYQLGLNKNIRVLCLAKAKKKKKELIGSQRTAHRIETRAADPALRKHGLRMD